MLSRIKNLKWLLVVTFYNFIATINFTLLNFFLWEKGKSIPEILRFNLFIFVAIIAGILFWGFLARFIGIKIIYLFGLLFQIAVAISAYLWQSEVSNNLEIVCLLMGFSSACISLSESLINLTSINEADRVAFSSKKETVMSLLSLASPMVVAFFAGSVGYQNSFLIVTIAIVLLAIVFILVKVGNPGKQTGYLGLILSSIFNGKIRNLGLVNLGMGMSAVYSWGLLNIIILSILGSLTGWSYVSTALAVFGIIVAVILKTVNLKDTAKAKSIITIGALLYAIVPLLLLTTFSVELFILYTFIKLMYDKTNGVITFNFLNTVENRELDYYQKRIAFTVFNNFFYGIGRLIPILILISLPSELLTIELLTLGLAICSFMPVFFAPAMKHS